MQEGMPLVEGDRQTSQPVIRRFLSLCLCVFVVLLAAALTAVGAVGETGQARPEPAVERSTAGLYRQAVPPYRFRFPRDHAAHPQFQTEWWYYTGHLYAGERRFGYELTFFQVGIDPKRKSSKSAWALHTLYFAHFTLTDENRGTFRFAENISRPALRMAGSETDRYHVWIHDWSAELLPDGKTQRLKASTPDFAVSLDLNSAKPPVVHGTGGVSQKAAGVGRASHYYSMTRMETMGKLTVHGEDLPVAGLSWMDHEFGSNQLTPQQAGWDWFSLQLDNHRELMLYVMRLKDGRLEPVSSGTLVNADGTWKHLPLSAYQIETTARWKSPHTGGVYPAGWIVRVPGENLELRVSPTVPDQELATEGTAGVIYWEGSVRVEGKDRGKPVRGVGYVELTGYTGPSPGI
jgi:predicted secreted hydrolase